MNGFETDMLSNIKDDIQGRQLIGYKILMHLNAIENYRVRLNIISDEAWRQHYTNLSGQEVEREEAIDLEVEYNTVDSFELSELRQVIVESKNRLTCGVGRINVKLLKCGILLFLFKISTLTKQMLETCRTNFLD